MAAQCINRARRSDGISQSAKIHFTETAFIAGLLASQAGSDFGRSARCDAGFVRCINKSA